MTDTTLMSSDGFPVSATTIQDDKHKIIVDSYTEMNKKVLEKMMENKEKDENELVGEAIESQVNSMDNNAFSEAIMNMAKCPCCDEFYMGNVMQCTNGHCLCETCRDMVHDCPVCKIPYGSIKLRNLTTETLLTQMNITVSCAYSPMGCTEKIPYSQIHDHWRKCKFRPAECFYGNACGFKAKSNADYIEHLCAVHAAIPTDTPGMEFFELRIQSISEFLTSTSYSRKIMSFIHKFNDDYLIIQFMQVGTSYDYVMSVHSINNNLYVFSSTIQASNVLFTEQQEFPVMSMDILHGLYSKLNDSYKFYDYYKKKMTWCTAQIGAQRFGELGKFPTAGINCMIRSPSEREVQLLTKMSADPNHTIIDNPVEDALTEGQIQQILMESGEDIQITLPQTSLFQQSNYIDPSNDEEYENEDEEEHQYSDED
jgi:hypothetical protein